MGTKIKLKLPRRNDEKQIQEGKDISKKTPSKRRKAISSVSVQEYSESDTESTRPKKKKKGAESSSHVSVHVDVFKKKIRMIKKRKGKRIDSQSSESSFEGTSESDEEQIEMENNRKGKKKGKLVVSVKKNRKNDEVSSKPKNHGKMVVVENADDNNEMKGLWILQNFDVEKCSLTLSNNRKIKVTRELIHDILGIPMGDKKVVSLRETSTEDPTTAKWRDTLPLDLYDPNGKSYQKKIKIGKLENYLGSLSHGDWDFKIGFLVVVFFSIFAHGNKDGSVNQRFLPSLENIDEVANFDWCSYCLECLHAELKKFKATTFKAWSTKLLNKREREESNIGFGNLPILEEDLDENIIPQLYTPQLQLTNGLYGTINRDEELQQFKTKSSKEMREYIAQNLAMSKELMLDMNEKMKIALSTYPDVEEINMLVEERNTFYKELYKFSEEDIQGDENGGNIEGDEDIQLDTDEYLNNEAEEEDDIVEDGVYSMINVSKEEIVIPSTFFKVKERVQNIAWEENKNLAIVVFDDPGDYTSQGSSDYYSSQERIGSDEEIEFPEAIVDDMFTEDDDSFPNELEEIVHEVFNKQAPKEIPQLKDVSMQRCEVEVAECILEEAFLPTKDELNGKGPFLCTQENIQTEGLVSDMRKVAEKQNQVIPKTFSNIKMKLVKKPLSTEKGFPIQKERHEVLVTEIPLSSEIPISSTVKVRNVGGQVRNVGGQVTNVGGKSVLDIRGTDKGKKKVSFEEQDIAIEGKHEVKFSRSMTSPFYVRKVDVRQKLTEEEKKVIEYIWSTSNDGSEVVFKTKDTGMEWVFLESLFPRVEVACNLIDVWSIILNYEELKRDKLAGSGNLYCNTSMLPHYVLETGANEEKIRRTMDGNMKIVLEQARRKNLSDVHLVFLPMIQILKETHNFYLICFNMKTVEIDVIDNINNNLEVLDTRYGPYANLVIKSFIEYMKRQRHPKSDLFLKAEPKILQMEWRTNKNVTDCGVFVMRHMETYMGRGAFCHEFKTPGIGQLVQIKMLRAKYLAKIVLMEINEVKEIFLKEAEAYMKKIPPTLKLTSHENIKVPTDLFKRINERVKKVFSN
ncbi:ulp1 protease family, C-terminal catalytic domain-containing protein [Artemisia annua]|uniref:Ulp1 protease family, C-terminal catalytic domain-containing protein n=1 Tax=Artemisia annua TaxID=35608 RepID=A0A2U1KRI2_ARTAN|nr:ulp1 protease family, C-terminal catalytic domain-containing protein [Artemisia annua]